MSGSIREPLAVGTRRTRVAFAMLAGGLMAGCSSPHHSGSPGTTPSTAPGSDTSAVTVASGPLQSELLVAGDLPPGWTVNDSTNTANQRGCDVTRPLFRPHEIHQAEVRFLGGETSFLDEIIAGYPNAASATAAFGAVRGQLDGCKNFTEQATGLAIAWTVGQLSLGRFGDASAAWKFSGSLSGTGIAQDEVLVLKGDQVCAVAFGTVGTPDVPTTQSFVAKAVAKL